MKYTQEHLEALDVLNRAFVILEALEDYIHNAEPLTKIDRQVLAKLREINSVCFDGAE